MAYRRDHHHRYLRILHIICAFVALNIITILIGVSMMTSESQTDVSPEIVGDEDIGKALYIVREPDPQNRNAVKKGISLARGHRSFSKVKRTHEKLIKGTETVEDEALDKTLYIVRETDSQNQNVIQKGISLDQGHRTFLSVKSTHEKLIEGTETYILKPNICKKRSITLTICVESARRHSLQRSAVRATWGHYAKYYNIKTVLAFFLGSGSSDEDPEVQKNITAEADLFQDIIQNDYLDTYLNLTLKSISIVNWAAKYCNHSKYVLKADDDAYINVPILVSLLKTSSKKMSGKPFVLGYGGKQISPKRNKNSKWYVPETVYNKTVFPDYVLGGCYVWTSTAAVTVSKVAPSVPLFSIEDIYITGMVRNLTSVDIVRDNRISMKKRLVKDLVMNISGTGYTPLELNELHNSLIKILRNKII